MSSLIDCFTDLNASVGIITETWLSDGDTLHEDIDNLVLGTGLQMLCLNRDPNVRGFSHGGLAIIFKEAAVALKPFKLHNPDKLEVMMATGTIRGSPRKIAIVGCYVPPNYTTARARMAMELAAGAVAEAKRSLDDPMVVVAGDFNQWKIDQHLVDFLDLEEHNVGMTRGTGV